MSRKLGTNLAQLARQHKMSRSTFYRILSGATKNPRPETLQVLREAGLLASDTGPLVISGNLRHFAQGLTLAEIERLMSISLKPVALMSPEELSHLHGSLQRFPDLYQWKRTASPQDS